MPCSPLQLDPEGLEPGLGRDEKQHRRFAVVRQSRKVRVRLVFRETGPELRLHDDAFAIFTAVDHQVGTSAVAAGYLCPGTRQLANARSHSLDDALQSIPGRPRSRQDEPQRVNGDVFGPVASSRDDVRKQLGMRHSHRFRFGKDLMIRLVVNLLSVSDG